MESKERNKSCKLSVEGLDCTDCARKIENGLEEMEGVGKARINLISQTVEIDFDPKLTVVGNITEKLGKLGYPSTAIEENEYTLKVEGMDCADKERIIRKALEGLESLSDIKFDLINERLTVRIKADLEQIIKVVGKVGFKAVPINPKSKNMPQNQGNTDMISTVISGIAAVLGIIMKLSHLPEPLIIGILSVAIISGGYKIAIKGIKASLSGVLDMNFLMTIAVIGAVAIGAWEEGAMVVFLFSLSHLLERRSMNRARRAISDLMNVTPKTALVIKGDEEIITDVEKISVGETIIIKPGEAIPLDGEVIGGVSSVNQAPITGESMPVEKKSGDKVYAGSLNNNGILKVKVDKPYSDSTIARIIHLVEEAQSKRAPIQLFVDRFAKYYTPSVVVVSILISVIPTLFFNQPFYSWFYRSLVLLVIACPCALVISTPVSFVSSLTAAAKNGVLIKGGAYIERAAHINAFAFDKTGTITYGKPILIDIIPLNNFSKEKILGLAASLEKYSEHPLAEAIINGIEGRGIRLQEVDEFSAITGAGVEGIIKGKKYYLANHSFFERRGICDGSVHRILEKVENSNQTAILLGTENNLYGLLAIADGVKQEAAKTITELKRIGVEKSFIISGDNHRTTEAVGKQVGSDAYYGELLPENKLEIIRDHKADGFRIAMVGDGINDAPALATSDLGIAMGTGGTDVALETADVAIIGDDLRKIPFLIRLSKQTMRIIKQNIFLALGIKAIFMILTFFGAATLWMAVLADNGVSLMVISNSLRLLRTQKILKAFSI